MTVFWLLVAAFIVLGRLARVENGPALDRPIDPRVFDLYVREWRRRVYALDEAGDRFKKRNVAGPSASWRD